MRHLGIFVGFVLAACGGDGVHHLADAPPSPDGSPPIDAAPSPVTLTITDQGAPRVGVQVWFQEADSTLVSSTVTDANGIASAIVQPGAFVTAIDPFPAPAAVLPGTRVDDLRTFAGVKPGDHLVLTQPVNPTSITFTLSVPVDAGATTYSLNSSCGFANISPTGGSGALPGGLVTLTGCSNGSADLLIETFDQVGALHKILFAASTPVEDAGTVDLTADVYTDPTNASFAYSNAPVAVTNVQLTQTLAGSHGILTSSFGSADVSTGSGTIALAVPSATGMLAIEDSRMQATSFSAQDVVDWGPFATAYTLDLTGQLLPDFTAQLGFDVTNHTATWSESAGASPDFSIMQLQVDRTAPAAATWTWVVAAPYHAGAVALPVLPTDGAAFNPLVTDAVNVFSALSAKLPGGYDAVRAGVLSNFTPQPTDLVLGATGRAVIVQFRQLAAAARRHHQRL